MGGGRIDAQPAAVAAVSVSCLVPSAAWSDPSLTKDVSLEHSTPSSPLTHRRRGGGSKSRPATSGSCNVFVGWFRFWVGFGPAYVAGAPRSGHAPLPVAALARPTHPSPSTLTRALRSLRSSGRNPSSLRSSSTRTSSGGSRAAGS